MNEKKPDTKFSSSATIYSLLMSSECKTESNPIGSECTVSDRFCSRQEERNI